METATTDAATLVRAYYGSWRNGIATFDNERLAEVLAEDLDFEGSIAGKRRGAAGFMVGLQRFVECLKQPIEIQQQLAAGDQAAVLYAAEIPGGSMRFAEFFRVENGRIASIKLLYDASQYRALGGR
ncbi:MAG TPA: nuclear transport factor 2 family protein [Candidatus Dormibacteraeota bacterium]|nr:nuclear transport factor 2 family protein [Candidatus Dormibacteraeota bacterium]